MDKEERIKDLEAEVFLLKKKVEELITWVTVHRYLESPIHTQIIGQDPLVIQKRRERKEEQC